MQFLYNFGSISNLELFSLATNLNNFKFDINYKKAVELIKNLTYQEIYEFFECKYIHNIKNTIMTPTSYIGKNQYFHTINELIKKIESLSSTKEKEYIIYSLEISVDDDNYTIKNYIAMDFVDDYDQKPISIYDTNLKQNIIYAQVCLPSNVKVKDSHAFDKFLLQIRSMVGHFYK